MERQREAQEGDGDGIVDGDEDNNSEFVSKCEHWNIRKNVCLWVNGKHSKLLILSR